MKNFGITKTVILLYVCFSIGLNTSLYAQEWSKEQKEVWELTEKMFKYFADRNLDAYLSCLHEKYVSWFDTNPHPIDKNELRNWESYNLKAEKILDYTVIPVSITVADNVAIINYYYWTRRECDKGRYYTQSRITQICKKENEEWLVIGNSMVKEKE